MKYPHGAAANMPHGLIYLPIWWIVPFVASLFQSCFPTHQQGMWDRNYRMVSFMGIPYGNHNVFMLRERTIYVFVNISRSWLLGSLFIISGGILSKAHSEHAVSELRILVIGYC